MKGETKYYYQKRIRELQEVNLELMEKLTAYRSVAVEIYEGVADAADSGNGMLKSWLLKKLRRCLK